MSQPTACCWAHRPPKPSERAFAVRALRKALAAGSASINSLLHGVLWWKLSSHKYHFDDEPFILIIDQPAAEVDPLMAELLQLKQEHGKDSVDAYAPAYLDAQFLTQS